jgi:hypothetical protein
MTHLEMAEAAAQHCDDIWLYELNGAYPFA